ncbi:MAG TPA: chromate efflux transporter [Dehalococcoidia bacterium]|nr:chromate efflux transporter [Dehalococcoidia bacterium]
MRPQDLQEAKPGSLAEVAALYLKLGAIAFGGPAAHIAMMREEVVHRRRWLDDQRFLDLLGATNLIPGPNSTEMAIHVGFLRAGWRGLIAAGVCFILPAALMVLGLAWAYVEYGTRPAATWLLYGIKPVIIAIVLQALYGLLRTAVKKAFLAGAGVAVFALYLAGASELLLLFGAGALVLLVENGRRIPSVLGAGAAAPPIAAGLPLLTATVAASPAGYSALTLFLTFLKIGAVLYGSGYVLLAFLRNDFVVRLGWLTQEQLLDAVAIGQMTPGPVFTTATFVGYVVGRFEGAVLATVAIFLPSFFFVAAISPFVTRLRASPWASSLLDGVNVAAIGLMGGVTWRLANDAIVDALTAALALASLIALIRFRVNSAWLIAAGAAAGLAYGAIR